MFGTKWMLRTALIVVGMLAVTLAGCSSSDNGIAPKDEPQYATDQRVMIMDTLNVERARLGLPALETSLAFNTVMQEAVEDLVVDGMTNGEIGVLQRVHNAKVLYTASSETRYTALTAATAVNDLVSFLTDDNISSAAALKASYGRIGIGIIENDGGYTYWVVLLN